MSGDSNLGQNCLKSISLGDVRLDNPKFKAFGTGSDFTKLHHTSLETNKSFTQPCRIEQLLEELPEMLRQLHSFEPLCPFADQRQLARQALTALKNRQNEDFRNLASRLANDIAGAVD